MGLMIKFCKYVGLGWDELHRAHPGTLNGQQPALSSFSYCCFDAPWWLIDSCIQMTSIKSRTCMRIWKEWMCWWAWFAEPGANCLWTCGDSWRICRNRQWSLSELFTEVPAGDFFDVPSSTIHAIMAVLWFLRRNKNSDTTSTAWWLSNCASTMLEIPRPLYIQQTKDVTNSFLHSVPNN